MSRRLLYLVCLGLALSAPALAVTVPAGDVGLEDALRQPFTDEASHGVLWRLKQGLLGWRLNSAAAFGSLAQGPSPAKDLLDLRFGVVVEGESRARFLDAVPTVQRWPTWVQERCQAGDLRAEAVTLYSATDVVVAFVAIKNSGTQPLRVRPLLQLSRAGLGFKGQVELSRRHPAVWLTLDRSVLAGRRLVDRAGVWMGGRTWRAEAGGLSLTPGLARPLTQGLALEMTWTLSQLIRPGQVLRVPVLLTWGPDLAAVKRIARAQWTASALPLGRAWAAAKNRWLALRRALPPVKPRWERLERRAALVLAQSRYRARAALAADAISVAKGVNDTFSCVQSPLASLGLAETDPAAAEDALLDLTSFSAAQPAPVPPFTGEEKLQWEAAGLPLAGWAGWELYHRDPDGPRAASFLTRLGVHLINECAWWPPNRDGDGNGLYAFARNEEKPAYLRRQTPVVPAFFPTPTPPPLGLGTPQGLSPVPGLSPTATVDLETWSLPLTSLVTWQMQAASALADAAGHTATAQQCLAWAQKSQAALHDLAWDPKIGAYDQGLDGFWPLLLGLEPDENRIDQELNYLKASLNQNPRPWVIQGQWEPWRVYLLARTLAAYGDFADSQALRTQTLDALAAEPVLAGTVGLTETAHAADNAATAAVALEFLLNRQEQEMFLTRQTGEFSASWIQFRSLDGLFYMKRTKLDRKIAPYAKIKIETPKHGPILTEHAFIISSPERTAMQIQSQRALTITQLGRYPRRWFKDAHKVEWLLPAHVRFLVQFKPEAKQK